MASITKYRGKWRAQVYVNGTRRSKVLPSRQEARDWAARAEYELRNASVIASQQPMREIFDRYAREISPTKRGETWEIGQLARMAKTRLGGRPVGAVTPQDVAAWRDDRLRTVSPATCLREMNLLGAVFSIAVREWGLIERSPMAGVTRPKAPPPRDRLPSPEEIERLAYVAGDDLRTAQARAWLAFRFAGETAMRAGEIVGLTWGHVDLARRVAHLPKTKNGHPRDVPLSSAAVAMLEDLRGVKVQKSRFSEPHLSKGENPGDASVFHLTSGQLDALWRKLRSKARVEGLRFHDSRRWGTTRLAQKLDVMDLAKVTGHRDIRLLLNVYYKASAEDLAKLLD